MTYQPHPFEAIEAVIRAGRAEAKSAASADATPAGISSAGTSQAIASQASASPIGASPAQAFRAGAPRCDPTQPAHTARTPQTPGAKPAGSASPARPAQPPPSAPRHSPASTASPIDLRYATLLARILAGSPPTVSPAVQFVACGAHARATSVAFGIARATASLVGRTLLLDARLDLATAGSGGAPGGSDASVPDAFVPRLHHHRLQHAAADLALLYGHAQRGALMTLASPYRFVAIDVPAPAAGPAACALAPLCFGSVLVVQAGRDSSAAIAETVRSLTAAGGRIIGAVLDDAPAYLPAWTGG